MTKLNLARSEEKILCPYCGAEMKPISYAACPGKWRAWMSCTNDDCGAEGPMIQEAENKETGIGSARAAALRRYTPMLKPLTREDIMQARYEAAAFWIEFVGTYKEEPACHWYLWSGLQGYYARVVGYCEPWFLPMADYGKTWRCWERKPTDEERSAAEWEA